MGQKRRRYGSYAHCKQSRDITKIKRMTTTKSNACQIILGFYTICKANHHVVNNEFGPTRNCFVACLYILHYIVDFHTVQFITIFTSVFT